MIIRLLSDKRNERIVLRRSATLLAVETTTFTFMSKLVDADFPTYEYILAPLSGNAITVERKSLMRSVARIAAVADPQVKAPLVGLSWQPDEPLLRVCLAGWPDAAADVIAAETSGTGRVALRISQFVELLDEIQGQRVHLDTNGNPGPVLVTDLDDPDYLAVQTPCSWPFEKSRAA